VTEVARAFTGWTIERPQTVGRYVFRPIMPDTRAPHRDDTHGASVVVGAHEPRQSSGGFAVRSPESSAHIAAKRHHTATAGGLHPLP